MPSPETPSVQQTWVPAALKWRIHATLSRSLIMSSLFRTSTRSLLPHHLAIWEWHVDRGILHARNVLRDSVIHIAITSHQSMPALKQGMLEALLRRMALTSGPQQYVHRQRVTSTWTFSQAQLAS